MDLVDIFEVRPLSMVTKEGLQRIDIRYHCAHPVHLFIRVLRNGVAAAENIPVVLDSGIGTVSVLLPVQTESFEAEWLLTNRTGDIVARTEALWSKPIERTVYVMISSHTDIGLHDSQYIQRHGTVRTVDLVKELCDKTADRKENDRYRYTMEGTWFWNNYGQDRGQIAAQQVVRDHLATGKMGLCCGIAGNHYQTFGLEELCRSACERIRLRDSWGVDSHTVAVIDVNGIPMSIIQPYSEAGMENIIFAPNHWNPIPSTIWKMDMTKEGCYLNPDAGGGGSRIDVRYTSELPMVFWWEDKSGNRLLLWASTQYGYGGASIGLLPNRRFVPETVPIMEKRMGEHLPLLDERYPYSVWLLCCYDDDQAPNLEVVDSIAAWNAKWEWPKLRTLGDPDEPFRILRECYGDKLPVLRGDITGGWYQHPITAAELLARKFEADRLLPTAEKWSVVAALLDKDHKYPAVEFRRAWDHLLFNDEHSYGTSGYQGRRVYETWMQHRDWIDKAMMVAKTETDTALRTIADQIPSDGDTLAVFDPAALDRRELIETEDGYCAVLDIPAFGYRTVKRSLLSPRKVQQERSATPPVIENCFYRVCFAENGSIISIFDKEQNRELLDPDFPFRANEMVYTKDGHRTYQIPGSASFEILREAERITVTVKTCARALGAELVQRISLPGYEKRIDIDNRIYHARDMVNRDRYHRYLYFAFPFDVKDCRRYCHLNGAVAEYAKDVTGHGTDVYMAVNEWCCAENGDHGVALMMLDSQLMEFDHIHPDKTDFANAGDSSRMFAYVATDWLQMHLPGGSHLDYRFRFRITSYQGNYREARIPQQAERFSNPVQMVWLKKQTGLLDADAHSFLRVNSGQRLVGLKRADDGEGIIARLYGDLSHASFEIGFGGGLSVRRVRIDESAANGLIDVGTGFSTYRIGDGALRLMERLPSLSQDLSDGPAPIGSVYTGLITEPCAAAGEDQGQLYLLWGRNMEEDLSHYRLYRSESSGFVPDETTFLTDVQPEEYRVSRYVDRGLKDHTCYYYRVCAVDRKGRTGPMSREFSAFTRETL